MQAGLGAVALALLAPGMWAWQQDGAQLIRQGRFEEALAVYRAELKEFPKSVAANNGAGVALDLMGHYTEAQRYFAAAINMARTPLDRIPAQRAMAISHGFARDCKGAERFETAAFEVYLENFDY